MGSSEKWFGGVFRRPEVCPFSVQRPSESLRGFSDDLLVWGAQGLEVAVFVAVVAGFVHTLLKGFGFASVFGVVLRL